MGKTTRTPTAPAITAERAGRLYKLLTLTAASARPRPALLSRLKVDVRGFYRDLEFLRKLGIDVAFDGDKYRLSGELDGALARLPFPDPGLSLRDVLQLARGTTDAHRKLRRKVDSFLGPNGHSSR